MQEQGAYEALGEDPRVRAELSFHRPTFSEFIETAIHATVEEHKNQIIGDYLSPMPTELAEGE